MATAGRQSLQFRVNADHQRLHRSMRGPQKITPGQDHHTMIPRVTRQNLISSVLTSLEQVKDYQMASVEEYIGDSGKEFEVWIPNLQTDLYLFQLFSL